MTIKEALAAKVQCPVSDATLEVVLTDRALNGGTTYINTDKEKVELAVMDVLLMILTQPDVTEGGYAISHPDFLEKIKARLLDLATKYNQTDILDQFQEAKPTVTSRSVW